MGCWPAAQPDSDELHRHHARMVALGPRRRAFGSGASERRARGLPAIPTTCRCSSGVPGASSSHASRNRAGSAGQRASAWARACGLRCLTSGRMTCSKTPASLGGRPGTCGRGGARCRSGGTRRRAWHDQRLLVVVGGASDQAADDEAVPLDLGAGRPSDRRPRPALRRSGSTPAPASGRRPVVQASPARRYRPPPRPATDRRPSRALRQPSTRRVVGHRCHDRERPHDGAGPFTGVEAS